jgi:hypothetical protein
MEKKKKKNNLAIVGVEWYCISSLNSRVDVRMKKSPLTLEREKKNLKKIFRRYCTLENINLKMP